MTRGSLAATYLERAAAMRGDAERLRRKQQRLGLVRLAVFALMVLAAAGAVAYPGRRITWIVVAAIVVFSFARLLAASQRLGAARARALTIAAANEQAAARVERQWDGVPLPAIAAPASDDDPLHGDLAVFGPHSLAHLLPPLSWAHGTQLMREWLTVPARPDAIAARQQSVRELIPQRELGESLAVYALNSRVGATSAERFAAWSAAPGAAISRWMNAASFALPATLFALLGLELARLVERPYWLIPALVNLIVAGRARRYTQPMLNAAEDVAAVAASYTSVFAMLGRQDWTSERLAALQAGLIAPAGTAEHAMQSLARAGEWAAVRASPMLHGALQIALLWDCHVARVLAAWRRESGNDIGAWFAALAEIECLSAFAGLAAENPDFTFPHVEASESQRFVARALGHPLLSARVRVANDVTIGPAGTAQLISGSNMAGKSTLLRAVGLNVVLALAGAPVCAAELTSPPLRLRTSIQVRDSLERGLSYFMAEVARLREIVTAAEEDTRGAVDGPVLYLVDEMLSGTNSEERGVAIRLIVERLLESRAIGVITTHDLPAFCVDPIQSRLVHAHFRERVTGAPGHETMDFDYRLYDGPATSRNALRLLALAGLVPAR
jgi:hypothetical protein